MTREQAADTGNLALLLSDNRGIYIPQDFIECFDWEGIDEDDANVLSEGPDHEDYWEAWDNVLNDAYYTDGDKTFGLYQDGDLFAICREVEITDL